MRDYKIPDGRRVSGSPESRARRNIEAIQTLRTLEHEDRPPTENERDILAGYVGWGAVPQIFAASAVPDNSKPVWLALAKQLRELIGEDEFTAAQKSTVNAHYTSDMVVDAMWNGLLHLGAGPGMRYLEPALGIGNFFGRQPLSLLNENTKRIGIEKDALTAKIAKYLYPEATIEHKPFEETLYPKDYFDIAVSNVPFGDFGVFDQELASRAWLTKSIHNYFFVKALEYVRPGGIVAFITSRYTLDGYSPDTKGIRTYLHGKAELLAAVRLPDTAFEETAGTKVVVDILYFRKRSAPVDGDGDAPSWLTSNYRIIGDMKTWERQTTSDCGQYINTHYTERPYAVLGKEDVAHGLYRMDYTVVGDLTREALDAALLEQLPAGVLTVKEVLPETPHPVIAVIDVDAENEKIGGLFLKDGKLYKRVSRVAVEEVQCKSKTFDLITRQLKIRDVVLGLLDAERTDAENIEEWRAELNRIYDGFVADYGVLSKRVNVAAMQGDPDVPLLVALEKEFNPARGTADKAPIFSQRVLEPYRPVTHVDTAKEALSVALNERGTIDWSFMTDLTGRPEGELQHELNGLVFLDPTTNKWESAGEYLSGRVRTKLREARAIAALDARFHSNVTALENVQPEDIPPSQIHAILGATWVPLTAYSEFIAHILNTPDRRPQVFYVGGEYRFETHYARGKANRWETAKVDAIDLLRDTLNQRRIKVYDKHYDGTQTLDKDATTAARDRQQKLNQYFNEWLLAMDENRASAMARLYNDNNNDLRLRTYDGSHLTLPGMSRAALRSGDLEPYQKAAVWRQICQPNTYLAHAVGAGKSFEGIAGAMELKRLGLINRPMFVVPNATLGGWQMQFQMLYPGARVIVFSERDLEKSKRREVMARIATSKWDAVVVPHSSFQFIRVGEETFNEHYQRLEDQLSESILDAESSGLGAWFVKRLEKQKERLLNALKKRYKTAKDNTITWEQLGIDHLVVDECFPAGTMVETEHSQMDIKTIVDQRISVRVKSVNLDNGAIEWKRVTNWYRNPDARPLVRVTHEHGTFICTADHKIWTEEGYITACLLSENHSLRMVQRREAPQDVRPGQREALLAGVPEGPLRTRQEKDKILRVVRQSVHVQMVMAQAGSATSLLRPQLLGKVEDVTTRRDGFSCHGKALDQAQAWPHGSCPLSAHDHQQPDEVADCSREDAAEAYRPNIPLTRRKWNDHRTAEAFGGTSAVAGRICNFYGTSKASLSESAQLLQSGSSRSIQESRYRGGWSDSQIGKMEVSGPSQDGSLECSRVVSVEIYKLPGERIIRDGCESDPFVYCLEVEDNHNFFADGVLVSNCHEYKKLGFSTKQGGVAGIDQNGNQKTFDLLMKVRYTQKHGRGCVFMSGTPVTNTMGELYNVMVYLIMPLLERRKLGRFDEWAASFGQVVDVFEPKPEGGGYQVKGRFCRFVNLPELATMFRSFADVLTPDMLDIPRPAIAGGERQAVVNHLNAAQKVFMKTLQERAKEIRQNAREALPDNMVAIYGDAQMMALDVRMVMPEAPDDPVSRVNQTVENVYRIWNETKDKLGTQLIFSDFGKPRDTQRYGFKRFSVYDDIIAKLIERGIPASEVAHVYRARNKHERAELFRLINEGRIRVLLGSSAKMGVGVNVQRKIVALHHLTLPHRPSDLEQREGRALRQGNDNPEVAIFYYITKGSLDELKFASVARKARAFYQFMQGKSTIREMEDVDEMTPTLEAFQAAASGDPRVRRKLEVDNEIMRLGVLENTWRDERWKRHQGINYIRSRRERLQNENLLLEEIRTSREKTGRIWIIGEQTFQGDGISKKVGTAVDIAIRRIPEVGPMFQLIGSAFGVAIEGSARRYIRVHNADEWIDIQKSHEQGITQAVEYFINNVEGRMAKNLQTIERDDLDRREHEQALEQPWPYIAEYEALRKEQERLFQELGGNNNQAVAIDDNETVIDESVEATEEADDQDEEETTVVPIEEPESVVAVAATSYEDGECEFSPNKYADERGHQLLPDDVRKQIPRLSKKLADDPIVAVKFFSPYSNWTWYAVAGDPDGEDFQFFGYVVGHEREWGYFMLSELEMAYGAPPMRINGQRVTVNLPLVERECYTSPAPLSTFEPSIKSTENTDEIKEPIAEMPAVVPVPVSQEPQPIAAPILSDSGQFLLFEMTP